MKSWLCGIADTIYNYKFINISFQETLSDMTDKKFQLIQIKYIFRESQLKTLCELGSFLFSQNIVHFVSDFYYFLQEINWNTQT